MKMKEFYDAMLKTAEHCEMKPLSDEKCCQILAWVWAYGGSFEATVFGTKLNPEILAAQRRLDIWGGSVGNLGLKPILQKYLRELQPYTENCNECGYDDFVHPDWAIDLFLKFKLPIPHQHGKKK